MEIIVSVGIQEFVLKVDPFKRFKDIHRKIEQKVTFKQ